MDSMIVDCHVHLAAGAPEHGWVLPRLARTMGFRFLQAFLDLYGDKTLVERKYETALRRLLDATPQLHAAVVLAFDAVYDRYGQLDRKNTHFYVSNDYAIRTVAGRRKFLFGASVHPYRKDAVAEIERCVRAGAVLLKWLPITQNFNPADERCFPVYEALAHYGLPLLSHTGGEQIMPQLDKSVADPRLLVPALDRGVKVIAAHCGTRAHPLDADYLPQFIRMAQEFEHFYGDTSALNLPARWYGFRAVLEHPRVRQKLVHGSDWPIFPIAPPRLTGWTFALAKLTEPNWILRDVLIKKRLGLDDAYWRRAAKILRRR